MTAFGGFFAGKRVLVTGHTGFKGAWLSQWLVELGAEVFGFSDRIPTQPSLFEALGLGARIKDLRGDVRDAAAVGAAFGQARPQVLFHLAAQSLVRASYDEPKATFDVNVGGTVNVLEAVRKTASLEAGVIVSSDKCYENVEKAEGYRETDPLGGRDPYSASKACTEIVAHSYLRSFFTERPALATARAGNVIGGGDWAADRIVPDCARAWSNKGVAQIRNPDSTRPWQHVLEPLGGYLWLAARLGRGDTQAVGQAFNFGPGDAANRPVREVVTELAVGWPAAEWKVMPAADPKKEAALLRLDCSKAKERLGWSGVLNLPEAVALTRRWYQTWASAPASAGPLALEQIREYVALAHARQQAWAT